jgi:uncharacterized membrane-anchored protein
MSDILLEPIETSSLPERGDSSTLPVPQRNFWLAMAAQLLLLSTVAAPAIYTLNTGKTVFLQTAPVDPYDLLRGNYQILNYDIADRSQLEKLPGGKILSDRKIDTKEFFVTLALPSTPGQQAAPPNRLLSASAIAVSTKLPTNLPTNQIAIRGTNGYRIDYDIGKFYMPEAKKDTVNDDISRNPRSLLVEVKIDSSGHAVPVSLWVGKKSYGF